MTQLIGSTSDMIPSTPRHIFLSSMVLHKHQFQLNPARARNLNQREVYLFPFVNTPDTNCRDRKEQQEKNTKHNWNHHCLSVRVMCHSGLPSNLPCHHVCFSKRLFLSVPLLPSSFLPWPPETEQGKDAGGRTDTGRLSAILFTVTVHYVPPLLFLQKIIPVCPPASFLLPSLDPRN